MYVASVITGNFDILIAGFAVFVHVTRRTMERMAKLRERLDRVNSSEAVTWVETKLKRRGRKHESVLSSQETNRCTRCSAKTARIELSISLSTPALATCGRKISTRASTRLLSWRRKDSKSSTTYPHYT
jgi:hypothetical protein